jgi:hypothetical protein
VDLENNTIDVDPEYQREVVWTGMNDHAGGAVVTILTLHSGTHDRLDQLIDG